MKVKVRLVIMSHLSDVQEMKGQTDELTSHRLNFAKFLLMRFPNTDTEIDADHEYSIFKLNHPNL